MSADVARPTRWLRASGVASARRLAQLGCRAIGCPVIALALVAAAVGCKKADRPQVLAKVGSHEITPADFRQEIDRRRGLRQPVPDREALLEEMVAHRALLQRARRVGLDRDPGVQREIQVLLISRLRERELAPRLEAVTVSPEEVKAAYEQNLTRYTEPAKVRLSLLFLKKDRKMSEAKGAELRSRILEARQQAIAQPASGGRGPAAQGFGALAIHCSDDQASRYRGGDLGWLNAGDFNARWPRAVLATGFALDPGKVSEVIETEDGFYVVMKTDARASRVTPLDQVSAAIRQSLLVEKRRALEETFRQEATRAAGVTVDRAALGSFPMPSPVEALAQGDALEPPALPGAAGGTNRN